MAKSNLVQVGGELTSVAGDGIVADAAAIKDYAKNKTQKEVNDEVAEAISDLQEEVGGTGGGTSLSERVTALEEDVDNLQESVGKGGTVDQKIATAKSEVIGDAATDYNTLGKLEDKIQGEVANRTTAVNTHIQETNTRFNELENELELLNGSEVIVVDDHTAVVSPNTQKIYREPNVDPITNEPVSYTDWMCIDATIPTWKAIATYDYPGVDNKPTKGSEKLAKSGGIYSLFNPDYVSYPDIPGVGDSIKELYLDHYANGLYVDALVWDGSVLTLVIKDESNNIVASVIGESLVAGAVLEFSSVNDASVSLKGYIIMTNTTVSTSSINAPIQDAAFDLKYSTTILEYLVAAGIAPIPMDDEPTQNSNNPVKSGGLYNVLNPKYTDNDTLNLIFKELFINGYKDGYYFNFCTWDGSNFTFTIKDTNDEVVSLGIGLDATPGEVFVYSDEKITIYAVFTQETYSIAPQNNYIMGAATNIQYNPMIFDYIAKTKTDMEYPLNISRFDIGDVLPNADHHASWITINRRMDESYDSVLSFANKTYSPAPGTVLVNKWFDFYGIGKHSRGEMRVSKCSSYIDWDSINNLSTSDALMMPVIVAAVNNIDGDNNERWHTGGAHGYEDIATGPSATMREISNTVRVDGKLIEIGKTDIVGKVCTIDVVNNVQGYNTCKEDGTGREILQQRYHIECTNDYCDVYTELVALEDVILYGMQVATGISMTGMNYRFIGSESKRGLYTYNGANVPSEGDNKINAIRIINDGYNFDVEYDLNYGLGNKNIGNTYNCSVTSAAKGYFQNIPTGSQISLSQGDSVSWKVRLTIKKA